MTLRRIFTGERLVWLAVWVATVMLVGGVSYANASAQAHRAAVPDQVLCPAGAPLIVSPGGSWSCGNTPSPSSMASSSAAPSISPSSVPTSTPTISPGAPGSSSASPSPSSTSFPLGCRNRLAECGYPHEGNTGVPEGTVLTPIHGNLTIRAAGTWQDLEVIGCVEINTSAAVVIRRLKVHPPAGGTCALGNIHHEGAGNILIEDTTSYCDVARGHGFWISSAVLNRVRTYGCENGFELNANTTVRRSMIAGSENGGNDPHGDGIQSQGGDNVVIEGNTLLQGAITSAIITNPDLNRGWKVRDNFLGGGAYSIYCPENGKAGWEVVRNRFIAKGQPGGAAYGMTDACGGLPVWGDNNSDATTVNDNRYDHNGAQVQP